MNAPLQSHEVQASSVFARFIDVLLPNGGTVALLVEAYFDESIGHGESVRADGSTRAVPIMCVAGYLVESEQAKLLCKEWQDVLDWKGLPFFHMVDCAHGNGPFAKLSKGERIEVASRMIGNIKRRTILGVAFTVNVDQYERLMPRIPSLGSAYSFCAHGVIAAIGNWIEETRYGGDVSYFFEAGHASQPEANQIMNMIFAKEELRILSGYTGHAFLPKNKALPLQAADLLAWQFYTDIRRQLGGALRHRKDFESLIQHPHEVTYVTPSMLVQIARVWGYDTTEAEAALRKLGITVPKRSSAK